MQTEFLEVYYKLNTKTYILQYFKELDVVLKYKGRL